MWNVVMLEVMCSMVSWQTKWPFHFCCHSDWSLWQPSPLVNVIFCFFWFRNPLYKSTDPVRFESVLMLLYTVAYTWCKEWIEVMIKVFPCVTDKGNSNLTIQPVYENQLKGYYRIKENCSLPCDQSHRDGYCTLQKLKIPSHLLVTVIFIRGD